MADRAMPDLHEYHACLLDCGLRNFPCTEKDVSSNGALVADLKLSWKSAFVNVDQELDANMTVRSNLTYERSCVLWNIAALESYCAAVHEDWKTKDGRAGALRRYGIAAAILKHIRLNLIDDANGDDGCSPDLSPQCLHMCERLMLAQGQMACYEAAKIRSLTANQPMHNLLAKLAVGVADFYNEVLKASQDNEMLGRLPITSRSYGAHAKVMSMLYQSRSQYLESMADKSQRAFGYEIVRLSKVTSMCTEGLDFMGSSSFVETAATTEGDVGNMKQSFDLLKRVANERKIAAEKDNREIYHDDILDLKHLPIIQGQDLMRKPVPLPDTLKPQSLKRPFFANLPV
eukprot:CAMPEP_0197829046 /NCGR_PEP_ID=MMETSP1437-20131217/5523_1 /TAXON_ID=49252 ORGANISM="Eucampia antarctica, Strain CCMP1452" /NCGR_SAMPLE_ID=MMETSP1437 /ASSEMBLY_ACC=CAM_ASM_001096 /LENGTH=344 /DNA_ID=CAMNT_0043430521 /DNA_START=224 /DNA_END=1258 /DNA_ORIENTATION=+